MAADDEDELELDELELDELELDEDWFFFCLALFSLLARASFLCSRHEDV